MGTKRVANPTEPDADLTGPDADLTEGDADLAAPDADLPDDDRLRAEGVAIILGEQKSPSTLTPAEIRRAVELAADDISRLLAPFGFIVRPIDAPPVRPVDQAPVRPLDQALVRPVDVDPGARSSVLAVIFLLAVFLIVVAYLIASEAGII